MLTHSRAALASLFLVLVTSVTLLPSVANAADGKPDCGGDEPVEVGGGWVCGGATSPGTPGGGGSGGSGSSGGQQCVDGRGNDWVVDGKVHEGGKPIPCTMTVDGKTLVWVGGSHQCYAELLSGFEPANPSWWGNTDPKTPGSWYFCGPDGCVGPPCIFFIPGAQPLIDPRILARRALDQMQLAKPAIHMAPQPPLMTYVGLDTWLWMDPGQMDQLKLTVSAGPTSVTVTADAVQADWDFGKAGSTTCTSAGRAWVKGMTNSERTDCSHTFDQVSDFEPQGVFPVTSTITYQVDWVCNGACLMANGTLGAVPGPTSQDAIRVGERQSVVVR